MHKSHFERDDRLKRKAQTMSPKKKKKKLNCCYIGLAKISETNTEHNF